MASPQTDPEQLLQPDQVFTPQELAQLITHIKESGELGRSRIYSSLLDYLLQCSRENRTPKEIEIAMDALGKGADYDASRDSTVRVYIHQLRKKLDSYYETHAPDVRYRIIIPRGQYGIAAIDQQAASDTHAAQPGDSHRFGTGRLGLGIGLVVALLLTLNLASLLWLRGEGTRTAPAAFAGSGVWQAILDDDLPIMLVMGDYYIFGELNEQGNIGRMVRDFTINSSDDLEDRHFSDWETTHNYQDLDLSYIPEGSAYALARIIPILSASGKRFHVAMMSDLTTVDLRENHIIYVGYISALDKLTTMVFAASHLQVGRSYDELLNVQTGRYFTSDAGLPEQGQRFRDYGLFTTFPASSENQILVISGMRDAGLMYTAQALSEPETLTELDRLTATGAASLEALFEVYGVDRMHFDGRLVYSDNPDPALKWRRDLTGAAL